MGTPLRYTNPNDCRVVKPRPNPSYNPKDPSSTEMIIPRFACMDSVYGGKECTETSIKPGQVPNLTIYSGEQGCRDCASACMPYVIGGPGDNIGDNNRGDEGNREENNKEEGTKQGDAKHMGNVARVGVALGISALVVIVIYALMNKRKTTGLRFRNY